MDFILVFLLLHLLQGVDLYHENKKYFGLSEFIESTLSGHSIPLLRYDSSFEAMVMALGKRYGALLCLTWETQEVLFRALSYQLEDHFIYLFIYYTSLCLTHRLHMQGVSPVLIFSYVFSIYWPAVSSVDTVVSCLLL